MKPLRLRLQAARKRLGVSWEVLERDYLLSWILAGLFEVETLRDKLLFKGGTALKKCFFGEYRFSEDLDFSGVEGVPTGATLEESMQEASRAAEALLDTYAPVEITCVRYAERDPHPGGQEAFAFRAQMPWQRRPQTRVLVEVSVDEPVLRPALKRKLLHDYGEPLEAEVWTYALEEIVAEKLRAILQHIGRLEERGWSRSRARDYYDLWRVLSAYHDQMDLSGFRTLLQEKCRARGVGFTGPSDFFREPMPGYTGQTWTQWLGPLVPDLPAFDMVVGGLRPHVEALLGTT